jgi:galactokinase
MSAAAAAAKGELFERVRRTMDAVAGPRKDEVRAYFVPGRLEVLGKHTDYAGGRSLLCTVERGICAMAVAHEHSRVRMVDAADGSTVSFAVDPALLSADGPWSNYPMTVARRVARNFPGARRGADIAFISDLPRASGMSSSSALMIATFLAIADANRLERTDAYRREIRTCEDLAGYLATIENGQDFGSLTGERGVGTFGGSEDHVAILCCRPGEMSQYAFCPVRHERKVPLPAGYVFVIGVSGVAAEKTGAARERYNRAAAATSVILTLWRAATGREDVSVGAALDQHPDTAARIRDILRGSDDPSFPRQVLVDRLEQFVAETSVIIPAVGDLIARNEIDGIGPLVDSSQAAAERLLGNQIPETIALTRSARTRGAVAASAFGAGFGGSVWALVPIEEAAAFEARWAGEYRKQFPAAAGEFFSTRPGPPALVIDDFRSGDCRFIS